MHDEHVTPSGMQYSTLDVESKSSEQTQRLGAILGELVHAGDLILLDGQLGAGKTTFTQGLAAGMHIPGVVNSPTFTLLKEYQGAVDISGFSSNTRVDQPDHVQMSPLPLYHFDLYRLDDPDEIIDLGFEDYFYGSGVSVVEWADKATELWPAERLVVRLTSAEEGQRHLLFVATGTRYRELLQQFQKKIYAITGL